MAVQVSVSHLPAKPFNRYLLRSLAIGLVARSGLIPYRSHEGWGQVGGACNLWKTNSEEGLCLRISREKTESEVLCSGYAVYGWGEVRRGGSSTSSFSLVALSFEIGAKRISNSSLSRPL